MLDVAAQRKESLVTEGYVVFHVERRHALVKGSDHNRWNFNVREDVYRHPGKRSYSQNHDHQRSDNDHVRDCAMRNLARCKLPIPAWYMRRRTYRLITTAREHLLARLANCGRKVSLEWVLVFRARWEQFGRSDYQLHGRDRKSETYQRFDVLIVRNEFQILR